MNTLQSEIRYCADIDMFTLDRSIALSCVHRTQFCEDNCFNNKLFKVYPNMHKKDERNELAWEDNDVIGLAQSLSRRKKQTKRARFMSRGEAISNFGDIDKVYNIVSSTKDTIWWLPTRAWRNPILFAKAMSKLNSLDNLRILCSMDSSNTVEEWEHIENSGFSSMFFGNDAMLHTPKGTRMFKCPKTWQGKKGHCSTCKSGCFRDKLSKHGPVHVHLKQH